MGCICGEGYVLGHDEDSLRDAFWYEHPEWEEYFGRRQNDCPADIRVAWCDFIQHMVECAEISESLARKVAL